MLKDSAFTAFQLSDPQREPGCFGPAVAAVAGMDTAEVCVGVQGWVDSINSGLAVIEIGLATVGYYGLPEKVVGY